MRYLRWIVVSVLVVGMLLVPARAARPDAPTQCQLQPASLGGSHSDLAGFVGTNYQYDVPVGVDSVAGGATVQGYPRWFPITLDNDSLTSVSSPAITISSGLGPSAFGGTLPTATLPSSCGASSLAPGQELQLMPGQNSGGWLSASGEQESFALGYDSTRTVTPSTVPVGGGNVTVRFAVTITDDSRFTSGQTTVGVNLNGPNPNPAGTIVSLSDPTNLDQGETVQENSWNTWVLQNALAHKTYGFTAVVHVDNPLKQAGPWAWVPQAEITVTEPGPCDPCGEFTGSSVRVPEPDLDGSTPASGAITLSVGDSTHSWNVGRQTSWVAVYPGGLFPDVFAQVNAAIGAGEPPNVDSIASGTTFTGQRNWFALGVGTPPGSPPLGNPTVSVESGYDPSLLDPGFGPPASSLPIVFTGDQVLSQNNGGPGIGSTIDATFQSPCDIFRSVSPLIVPVGGGQQTVDYSLRCSGMDGFNLGVGLGVPGASIVSFKPPSNLDQGENLLAPGLPSPGGAVFGLQGIQSGKQYEFGFVVDVPNPFGVPFADTPNLKTVVGMTQPTGCYGCGGPRTSVTVAEQTLDGPTPGAGSVTFSTTEPHVWAVEVSHGFELDLGGTQQGSLDYSGPAGATDGQPVRLTAVWSGGGLDGTAVAFTLGTQSCTGTTSGGSASCTIMLAQPVGTYTLVISSPGDVTVFPATASLPFSLTGPTSSDQCKNSGWKVFGIFKNQGDCVSYVATKGKNPPNG